MKEKITDGVYMKKRFLDSGKIVGTDSESSTDKAAFRDREEKTAVEEDGRAEPM